MLISVLSNSITSCSTFISHVSLPYIKLFLTQDLYTLPLSFNKKSFSDYIQQYHKIINVAVTVDVTVSIVFLFIQGHDYWNWLLGRLRRVDLIIYIWGSDVHPLVRTSVRLSAKSFSDSDEIWYVGRGR